MVLFVIGSLVERFLIRRVHSYGLVYDLLLTFGLGFALDEIVKWIWGTMPLDMNLAFATSSITVLGVTYPVYRLFILAIAIAVLAMLILILFKTNLGIIIRAAVDDSEMANALGINIPILFNSVFAFGSAPGGTGRSGGSPPVHHIHGFGLPCAHRRFRGRCRGWAGKSGRRGPGRLDHRTASILRHVAHAAHIDDLHLRSNGCGLGLQAFRIAGCAQMRKQFYFAMAAVAFFLVSPSFFGASRIMMLNEIMIFALYAMSYNLLLGYGGLLSFGHSVFLGFGAYVTGVLLVNFPEFPFLALVLLSTIGTLLLGLTLGLFLLRQTGASFALLTMAIGGMFSTIALKWSSVTGGDDGICIFRPDINLYFLQA